MVPEARSINISNCIGITAYEVLRQWDYLNLSKVEVQKGENYIPEGNWKGIED
jgi:tRNA (cytidine/uridine-2'-O-)-methyltransferase